MIREALRTFCESPYRWLIVTGGTFVVTLVLVVPLVDVYCAERDEKNALLAEVDAASRAAGQLDQFQRRVDEKLTSLHALEARTVDDESLPQLRDRLVDLARKAGCSLRRLNVGPPMSRPWHSGDDPIRKHAASKAGESKSQFTLQWRPITISLSGSITSLRSMLNQLEADKMFVHTKSFEIYPSSARRQTLTLEMELWYFTLARST